MQSAHLPGADVRDISPPNMHRVSSFNVIMTVDGTEEGCRGIPQFVAGTPEPSMMRSQESPASSPIPDKQFNKNEEGKESPPIGAPRLPDLRFTTASSADVTVQHIGAAENAATS